MTFAWTATAIALTTVGLALALAVVAIGMYLWCRQRAYSRPGDEDYCAYAPRCSPEELMAQRMLVRSWSDIRGKHEQSLTVQDLNLPGDHAAFVGVSTVRRCCAALEASTVDTTFRPLIRLFDFARRILQDDDTFFSEVYATYGGKRCIQDLVRLQTAVATAISVNRALDAIGDADSDHKGWREHLENEVSRQLGRLYVLLEHAESPRDSPIWSLKDDRQRLQAAVMLYYELQEQNYGVVDQFPDVLSLVHWGFTLVAESHDVIVPVSQPTWFDPCILLRRGDGGSQRRAWRIVFTDVGCSLLPDNSSASEEECIRRAALWSKLHHPNVVALEAASYVGTPFFVYAHGVPLSDFANVKKRKSTGDLKWTRLYEAALGLQYLQSRGVAFHALTPESIMLVEVSSGNDQKRGYAKSDSAICKVNCDRVVSLWWPSLPDRFSASDWRWLAPERLEGGAASLESDVFSFGMCILQVLTGEEPWTGPDTTGLDVDGSFDLMDEHPRDATKTIDEEKLRIVKQHAICTGKLPDVISSLEDNERNLICKMCAREPQDRVSISYVVAQLQRLAETEMELNKARLRSSEENMNTPTTMNLASITLLDGLSIEDVISTVRQASVRPSESDSDGLAIMQNSVLERVDRLIASITTHSDGSITKEVGDQLVDVVSRLVNLFRQTFKGSIATLSVSTTMSWLSASYGASTVLRRQTSDVCRSLHLQLDRIISSLDAIHQQNSAHSDWRTMWDFNQLTESHIIQVDPSQEQKGTDQYAEEKLIVLQFEVQHHASSYPKETVASMCLEIDLIEQRIGPRPLPNWFLPAYEVEFDALDAFAQGSFGSVHRGRWLDTSVVIKKVFASGNCMNENDEADQVVFVREADIWSSLRHENVVQLYGACHLRGQRFFVCEFAPFGTLDAYLRSQRKLHCANQTLGGSMPKDVNVWRLLYGVGCGLKFLHQHGIAHGDLKCNNVLIGHDGTPKLTDFGLSEAGKGTQLGTIDGISSADEAEKPSGAVGAYRWKAPEVLRGDVSTSREADVFSFGMVILEAVTGEVPWGRGLPDAAVKYHAMNGQLPLRPRRLVRGGFDALANHIKDGGVEGDEFADDEWELVQAMCRSDPSARLPLREAVSRVLQFSLRH